MSDGMVTVNLDPRASAGASIWRIPEKIIAIAAGGQHNLVLTAAGRVLASGSNQRGQVEVPPGLSDVVAIAAGYAHSLALRRDGTVTAWGNNTRGATDVPEGLTDVVAISGGGGHSLAVRRDGTVVVWGQLGRGDIEPPAATGAAISVSSGWECCFAIQENGEVVAWGETQLGSPRMPAGLTGVVSIDGGGGPGPGWVAARDDGSVLAGSLYDDPPAHLLYDVDEVSAGEMHAVARRRDGTVVGWGSSPVRHTVPAGLRQVTSLSAGNDHSLALRTDGTVVAWGKNGYQQLLGPHGTTAEFVEWSTDGYYLPSIADPTDPYAAEYGERNPRGGHGTLGSSQESFDQFVRRRLKERPRPAGPDTMTPRYWVGAGEVLLDLLLAATNPSNSDEVLATIHAAVERGDSVAGVANQVLELWASKAASGDTTSLSDVVTDEFAPMIVKAYRRLTLLYVGAADADRFAILDATLSEQMGGVDDLPAVLKVMLTAGLKDLDGVSDRVGEGAAPVTATASKPSGGCYVATAVYGAYDCPEVWVLRRFRDGWLATTSCGRWFIRVYYRSSPRLVQYIGGYPRLARAIRSVLNRFVAMLRRAGYENTPYSDR
ncbi:hypothetical protein GCM10009775_00820 [Microbacterium aoyamense]|uniref:Uncharacterized protein n=1 Tax=Microbacterium aoyamense TaxID=344166 RepID=A0ABN2P605_9MICO|nr:CFI-box-CTERM domain-containing protein [Microbacterium aoyamense]